MNLKTQINEKANQWLMKEKEGLTLEEENQLNLWLENIHHRTAYDENKKLINECINLDNDFLKELEDEITKEEKEANLFYKSRYLIASIVIACLVVFSLFKVNNYYFKANFSQDYITANTKELNIKLPDNSTIDLDVKTQIEVKYYNTKRTVTLNSGKAMFSIAKDKEKPFLIKTGNIVIEVLGTKFEVVHLNNIIKINVLEGLVKVSHIYNSYGKMETLIQLKKADTLSLDENGKFLNHEELININEIANWKNDIIKFDKTTLKEASSLFERYSNKKMKFETYELSQLKISGKFSTLKYDTFLEAIELIYPIKIQKDNDVIKITQK
ncbi:siderophore-interacting protein [Halarcobacter mediterraneus]|uniref:Siderophore-interacting protein n=1 Tax=Halarcobacter mediterraneus TaxID=2023153 RepID=A0A4Q1B2B8_9BACT|nr:FecR domain-containing protein [Halarcobacter mediterraneus]RXK14511.1 siderophore-interacting protein [Halarcobacter mediterraneus]